MSDVIRVTSFAEAILRFGYDVACQRMAQVEGINHGHKKLEPEKPKPKMTLVPKE